MTLSHGDNFPVSVLYCWQYFGDVWEQTVICRYQFVTGRYVYDGHLLSLLTEICLMFISFIRWSDLQGGDSPERYQVIQLPWQEQVSLSFGGNKCPGLLHANVCLTEILPESVFIAACSFGKEQSYHLSDSPEWISQNDVMLPLCCRNFSGEKHPDRENNSRVNLLRFQNKNPHAGREKLKPTFSLYECLRMLLMSVWYYIHVFS